MAARIHIQTIRKSKLPRPVPHPAHRAHKRPIRLEHPNPMLARIRHVNHLPLNHHPLRPRKLTRPLPASATHSRTSRCDRSAAPAPADPPQKTCPPSSNKQSPADKPPAPPHSPSPAKPPPAPPIARIRSLQVKRQK